MIAFRRIFFILSQSEVTFCPWCKRVILLEMSRASFSSPRILLQAFRVPLGSPNKMHRKVFVPQEGTMARRNAALWISTLIQRRFAWEGVHFLYRRSSFMVCGRAFPETCVCQSPPHNWPVSHHGQIMGDPWRIHGKGRSTSNPQGNPWIICGNQKQTMANLRKMHELPADDHGRSMV